MSFDRGELVTESLAYDGGRRVTAYLPPETAETMVFTVDGSWHITTLSQALQSAAMCSTMVVGVHGLSDDEGRLGEYVPGFDPERFAAHENFFVSQVKDWVASRFGVALPAERTGVWGASLGGEFALAMGVGHPNQYGAVFAASPGGGYKPPSALPTTLPSFYLVAGNQEQFFLNNAMQWANALRDADADVVMLERDGGHGEAFWFEEFPLMVERAFGR